jgi:intraflagellar transport protein 52
LSIITCLCYQTLTLDYICVFFLDNGGGVLLLGAEGDDDESNAVTHQVTDPYGVWLNNDAVVRTVQHAGYYHPKELFVKSASLSDALSVECGKKPAAAAKRFYESERSPEKAAGR